VCSVGRLFFYCLGDGEALVAGVAAGRIVAGSCAWTAGVLPGDGAGGITRAAILTAGAPAGESGLIVNVV
jgi:hypothetical protein